MPISKYQKKISDDLKKQALKMYKTGMNVRDIGKIIGKSHTWVWKGLKELEKKEPIDRS